MALIECPECGATVSDAARRCPQCGYPIRKIGASELQSAKEGAAEAMNLIQKKIDMVNDAAEKKLDELAEKDVVGQAKKSISKNKKVIIAVSCFLVLLFSWFAYDYFIRGSAASSGNLSESSTESDVKAGLTEAEIKVLAEIAVRNEIDEMKKRYSSFNSDIDSSKTRVEVNTIETDGTGYAVYGRGDYINKYGNIDQKYSSSGSYSFEFTVKMSEFGEVKSVKVD